MQNALKAAGFSGVDVVDGVIYARSRPALPEFTAMPEADGYVLAFAWPLRATPAQIAQWNAANPSTPMDIHLGETRIRTRAHDDLQAWAAQIEAMVAACTQWRRATRQRDEGM